MLDELDKEVNLYAMRTKEWYGWHFPEMTKLVVDNQAYCSVIMAMGMRSSAPDVDLSAFLDEDTEIELKNKAKMSMGSEITESDLKNITSLAMQVFAQ